MSTGAPLMDTEPRIEEDAARLVALYRAHVPIDAWPKATPAPGIMRDVIRDPRGTLGTALLVAIVANQHIHVPVRPTAAVVYLLLDEGYSLDPIVRYIAPQSAEPIELLRDMHPRDPRVSIARIMVNRHAQHEPHADYEAMAYLLRGWNLWVVGRRVQAVRWQPDWGMPRIGRTNKPYGPDPH